MSTAQAGRFARQRFLAFAIVGTAQTFTPNIPKVWDDGEVERFELPLVSATAPRAI